MRLLQLIVILLIPTVAYADVLVTWTASVSTPTTPVAGYAVHRADTCSGSFVKVTDVGPATTTYRHVGATGGAYRVVAWNSAGFTNSACVLAQGGTVVLPPPPPPPPDNVIKDLRVSGVTAQSLTVLATIPAGYKIAIRVGPAPMSWGTAIQQSCLLTPCLVTGLQPKTAYQVQAVLYTGTLNTDAVFGPIAMPVSFQTTDGPVDPVTQPPPTGTSVFKNVTQTPTSIIMQYSEADCPRGTQRRIKGNATKTITITCLR
jgi:hypothetical protein